MRDRSERQQWWRRAVFAVLCLVATLLPPAPAARAADDIASFAFLRDPTRSLTLPQVQDAGWTPITSTFGGGFTQAAYWLRVTFDETETGPFLLQFQPPTVDRIELFSPLPGGSFRLSQTGEVVRPTDDVAVAIGWFGFTIAPKPGLGPYYVRITTASPGAISVRTVAVDDVLWLETQAAAWNAFLFALLFLAAILVLKRLDPFGSISAFFFLAMIVTLGIYLFWTNGYARIALGLDHAELAQTLLQYSVGLAVFCVVAFHHFFLRDYDPPPLIGWISFSLTVLAATGPVWGLSGDTETVQDIAIVCYVLIIPVLILTVATLRRDTGIGRRALRMVYTPYIAVLFVNIAGRFGYFDNDFLYRHSLDVLCILSATMIFALLGLQDRADRNRRLDGEVALAQAQSDLTVARDYRDSQLHLVTAIAARAQTVYAETGSALAAGAFGKMQGPVTLAIDGLRDVIDRCLFVHRAESGYWSVITAAFDPGESLRKIAAAIAPPEAWTLDISPAAIVTDRSLFEIAVSNILSNAQRYGTNGAPVSVSLRPDRRNGSDGVAITVTNACDTAPPFDRAKVFDKFYRGPSARAQDGTGLGLFLAREALAAVSGQITLTHNAPDRTVTAELWVPSQ